MRVNQLTESDVWMRKRVELNREFTNNTVKQFKRTWGAALGAHFGAYVGFWHQADISTMNADVSF